MTGQNKPRGGHLAHGRVLRLSVVCSCALLLASCQTYQAQPLQDEAPLVASLPELRIDLAELPGIQPGKHVIDFNDGLDLDEVGILAVLNNPDLRAQRAAQGVTVAQAFAAGLLPDPQLNLGIDSPTSQGVGLVNAWVVGMSYAVSELISHQARLDDQAATERKVRLDLLWQEWMLIQQARTLAVNLALEQQRLDLLNQMLDLYRQRYEHSSMALANGNITLDANGTDLTALLDTLSQINQLEQTHNQTRHDFNLALGLQAGVRVELSPLPVETPLPPRLLDVKLEDLASRRPDLLALKAGYESQEARVRAAILSQFPVFGIELRRASDTSAVHTTGLGFTLGLPLFNNNRGNIAIERATREQLREEYQARLARTAADVDRLRELQDIIQSQQAALEIYLPRLKKLVERARNAYGQGDIDALTFLNMESTWVNKQLEQISLVQAGWENRIALEALLALPEFPLAMQANNADIKADDTK